MLHLPNNIKIIRSLGGYTQEQFRQKFSNVSLAMQKSYELGRAEPDHLYLQELSELSNVPIKDLTSKEITKKDISISVEKEEKVNRAIEVNGSYNERSLNNLTESNKVLAEANRTLAEANKTLAEANHVISKNHDELIQLTKMIVANSTASPKIQKEAFGPENYAVGPGFGGVIPSGKEPKPGRQGGKR